jgi:hypothetical protein
MLVAQGSERRGRKKAGKKQKKAKKANVAFVSASIASSIGAVRGWVSHWFDHVMGRTVDPGETLKSLRYSADNDLHAMTLEFNATFGADLATDELKAECKKPKETVGKVAMFLSDWLLIRKRAQVV